MPIQFLELPKAASAKHLDLQPGHQLFASSPWHLHQQPMQLLDTAYSAIKHVTCAFPVAPPSCILRVVILLDNLLGQPDQSLATLRPWRGSHKKGMRCDVPVLFTPPITQTNKKTEGTKDKW